MKENNIIVSKIKTAGDKNQPAGLNLVNALAYAKERVEYESEYGGKKGFYYVMKTVGIPDRRLPKAMELMRQVLNDVEYEVLCRVFGLGRPRENQVDFHTHYGMDQTEMSRTVAIAIRKLALGATYDKLVDLVPSESEVHAMDYDKQVESFERKIEDLRNQLIYEQDARLQAEEVTRVVRKERDDLLNRVMNERDQRLSAETALAETTEERDALRKRLELLEELRQRQERAANRKVKAVVNDVKDASVAKILEVIGDADVEILGVGETIAEMLHIGGIHKVRDLAETRERTLRKMRIGNQNVELVKAKLAIWGLTLAV